MSNRKSAVPKDQWAEVIGQYQQGQSMREVAEDFGVSLDAVTYILRKTNTPRRSASEASSVTFEKKQPSFTVQEPRTRREQEITIAGTMLYWAEGSKSSRATAVDFANSDVRMAKLFMAFLHTRYILNKKRVRILLYCYADQDKDTLISFWSRALRIPKDQFTRPYVRTDYRPDGRKMPHGLVHIRYADKKMLLDLLNLIESYSSKYASVVP